MTAARDVTTIQVNALSDAFTLGALHSLDGQPLIEYLMGRRWYGAKAGQPVEARITQLIPLPWSDGAFAIACLTVSTAEGDNYVYQLPLALGELADNAKATHATLARVQYTGGEALLSDAVGDPRFRRHLADAFANGAEFGGNGTRWIVEPVASERLVIPEGAEIRLGAAEQSNSSLIFDSIAILKLLRRIEPGVHPELEVTRYLTVDVGFGHTPVLLGAIWLEVGGERAAAGMLQEFVPNSVDAWRYALDCARPYFSAPDSEHPENAFMSDAAMLGTITRELHDALASDEERADFAPEPTGPEDVEGWALRAQERIREALSLLERQIDAKALSGTRAAEAQVLVRRRDQYLASVDEIVDQVLDDAGYRIRTHGDYHLGQVLRTPSNDFMIIDFEGEPARTLAERREKTSALRDVAGMLRSFAYVAATSKEDEGGSEASPQLEVRAARWERDVREAFLRGYLASDSSESSVLPEDEANVRRLLALFETEKVFYELAYELNNRPEWAWIPMRGISKLLVR